MSTGVLKAGVMEYWSDGVSKTGVMEDWSIGVLEKRIYPFKNDRIH
jgi:hypothetical protein